MVLHPAVMRIPMPQHRNPPVAWQPRRFGGAALSQAEPERAGAEQVETRYSTFRYFRSVPVIVTWEKGTALWWQRETIVEVPSSSREGAAPFPKFAVS